ncbi:MAG: hypothetical protein CL675_12625 [Bdellovibrionaceae bacterium]|nr:hypothetical protein [Pseudobdellovibrionaceae bacterium]
MKSLVLIATLFCSLNLSAQTMSAEIDGRIISPIEQSYFDGIYTRTTSYRDWLSNHLSTKTQDEINEELGQSAIDRCKDTKGYAMSETPYCTGEGALTKCLIMCNRADRGNENPHSYWGQGNY